jgi:hypothetical protein
MSYFGLSPTVINTLMERLSYYGPLTTRSIQDFLQRGRADLLPSKTFLGDFEEALGEIAPELIGEGVSLETLSGAIFTGLAIETAAPLALIYRGQQIVNGISQILNLQPPVSPQLPAGFDVSQIPHGILENYNISDYILGNMRKQGTAPTQSPTTGMGIDEKGGQPVPDDGSGDVSIDIKETDPLLDIDLNDIPPRNGQNNEDYTTTISNWLIGIGVTVTAGLIAAINNLMPITGNPIVPDLNPQPPTSNPSDTPSVPPQTPSVPPQTPSVPTPAVPPPMPPSIPIRPTRAFNPVAIDYGQTEPVAGTVQWRPDSTLPSSIISTKAEDNDYLERFIRYNRQESNLKMDFSIEDIRRYDKNANLFCVDELGEYDMFSNEIISNHKYYKRKKLSKIQTAYSTSFKNKDMEFEEQNEIHSANAFIIQEIEI